jgi:hypothetical protein
MPLAAGAHQAIRCAPPPARAAGGRGAPTGVPTIKPSLLVGPCRASVGRPPSGHTRIASARRLRALRDCWYSRYSGYSVRTEAQVASDYHLTGQSAEPSVHVSDANTRPRRRRRTRSHTRRVCRPVCAACSAGVRMRRGGLRRSHCSRCCAGATPPTSACMRPVRPCACSTQICLMWARMKSAHGRSYACADTCTHARLHARMHARTHTHARIRTHARTHPRIRARTRAAIRRSTAQVRQDGRARAASGSGGTYGSSAGPRRESPAKVAGAARRTDASRILPPNVPPSLPSSAPCPKLHPLGPPPSFSAAKRSHHRLLRVVQGRIPGGTPGVPPGVTPVFECS